MSTPRLSLAEPEVIVDHTSGYGPEVMAIRGTMLVNSRENLRELGLYERWLSEIPKHRQQELLLINALDWLPLELAFLHYRACDRLHLDADAIQKLGELAAARVIDTFLGFALRLARSQGIDSYWTLLRQNDRIWDRMWQGGRVVVLKTGPKDVLVENHGQPLLEVRFFRDVWFAYMHAIGQLFAKVAFAKLVRPRSPHPHSIAISGSWV